MRERRATVPLLVLIATGAAIAARPAAADWLLFYTGVAIETRGAWEVRGQQVRFTAPSGTLQSARAEDVDLAASAFLSWQIGDRRSTDAARPPAGAELHPRRDAATPAAPPACAPAKVVAVRSAETLEIARGGRREIVHLACLDAPEAAHRLPELAYFGESADLLAERLAPPGAEVCVGDESPPLADRSGHRIVYLRLADGRDLGEALLREGLALARGGACVRHDLYLASERAAIAAQAGNWGLLAHDLSLAVVGLPSEGGGKSALPPPRRAAARRS
jgi:endonuclease YncB( thermonuclease family)